MENFIYDIIVQVGDRLISTEFIDIEVSITDNEESGRICNVTFYNLKRDTISFLKETDSQIKVSILYNTTQLLEDYFFGKIQFVNDNREGADMVTICTCQDGIIDAINSPVSVSARSGTTRAQVIQDMVADSNVTLGQFPESLNTPHSSFGSNFISGELHSELQKFLGRKYVVTYKDGVVNIYERIGSLMQNNIVSSKLLYDFPKRQISMDTKNKNAIRKEYSIKVLPRPSFARGTQIKIVGSKYIDENFFTISKASFTLNKSTIYCDITLIEGALPVKKAKGKRGRKKKGG